MILRPRMAPIAEYRPYPVFLASVSSWPGSEVAKVSFSAFLEHETQQRVRKQTLGDGSVTAFHFSATFNR